MNQNQLGFTEFTFTNGENEIMFHVLASGQVESIYAYKQDGIILFDETRDKEIDITTNWIPSINPVYVICSDENLEETTKDILFTGEYSLGELSEGERETIDNLFVLYKLPYDVELYAR